MPDERYPRRRRRSVVSVEDVERLEETIAILSDPATMRRLAESDAEIARGEIVSAENLAEAVRRR